MPPPDDRYDDDRSSRGRFDDRPPPKKGKGLMITLIVLGVLVVVCGGICGGFGYWSYSLGKSGESAADTQLKKIGGGDLTAAYNGMSSMYKTIHTQDEFTQAMKKAKLDDTQSVVWGPPVASGQTMTFPGTVTLKSGGSATASVKVRMLPDFKTWEIDDVTSP